MAWFTGSFNNISDQISNFTKEVLVEGTQEIPGNCFEVFAVNKNDSWTTMIVSYNKIDNIGRYLCQAVTKPYFFGDFVDLKSWLKVKL